MQKISSPVLSPTALQSSLKGFILISSPLYQFIQLLYNIEITQLEISNIQNSRQKWLIEQLSIQRKRVIIPTKSDNNRFIESSRNYLINDEKRENSKKQTLQDQYYQEPPISPILILNKGGGDKTYNWKKDKRMVELDERIQERLNKNRSLDQLRFKKESKQLQNQNFQEYLISSKEQLKFSDQKTEVYDEKLQLMEIQYQDKISRLENEIKLIRSSFKAYDQSEIQDKNKNDNSEITKRQLDQQISKNEELNQQLTKLKYYASSLEQQKDQMKSYQQKVNLQQSEIMAQKSFILELKQINQDMSSKEQILLGQIESQEKQLLQLSQTVTSLQKDYKTDIQKQSQVQDGSKQEQNFKNQQLNSLLQEKDQKIKILECENSQFKSQLKCQEDSIQRKIQEFKEIQQTLSNLNLILQQKDDQISKLSADNQQLNNQIRQSGNDKQLHYELEEQKSKLGRLEAKVKDLNQICQRYEDELNYKDARDKLTKEILLIDNLDLQNLSNLRQLIQMLQQI